ncbi:MAG: major capsid protein [Bacteroidales bacterium]|nr:major capsid protein [Bacteroidales bacterium]
MNKPIFDIDQPSMQAEVESYEVGAGRVWPTFFPLRPTSKFDIKSLAGKEGVPISADKIAFNVKAPTKTRKTVGSWSGKLGKVAISREQDEEVINEYNDLAAIVAALPEDSDNSAKQEMVDMIYDDVAFVNEGMDTKIEVDACRIGSSGIQDFPAVIDGDNATQDIINFNVPDANKKGVAVVWSDHAHADGISDIAGRYKAMRAEGKTLRYAIMEQEAFEHLCAQDATLKKLSGYNALTGRNLILTQNSVTLEAINAFMRSQGYPTIVVIETEAGIEGKDGEVTTIKPWRQNVVTLAPSLQLGWTYWKTVPRVNNTEALQTYGSFYKVTRYSEVNPMLEVTLAEAYVQCVLINRNTVNFLNVANATTWNDGEPAS